MGLREEVYASYIDCAGLVSPHPCDPLTIASDNGPMYTSEYYVMLKMNRLLTEEDKTKFECLISNCITWEGMLCRWPAWLGQQQEQVDDYYGVLNACKQLGITSIPRTVLWAAFKYLGALNNVTPGKWTADSFLIRQPQLVAAMVAASFPSRYHPGHLAARIVAFPFFLIAAITIAISCIGEPKENTDPRRLSWHLVQSTSSVSSLCWFGSILWYLRLASVYGQSGMQGVASIYYKPEGSHPFAKYWVTK
jgi:hypothetical protein